LLLAAVGLSAAVPAPAGAQSWPGFGKDPQHSAQGAVASQTPQRVGWSTPVDLAPQKTDGGDLLTHYGSVMITAANTVLVPVKTGASGGFRVEARRGADGTLAWTVNSDYALPHHNWIPPFGPTLTPGDRAVVMPAAGGTVLVRTTPDKAVGHVSRLAFYGVGNYNADPTACGNAIQICTPITSDASGNLYFGYVSTGAAIPGYPNGIPSGLARVSNLGAGSFVAAAALSGDPATQKVAYNCAPALNPDGTRLYVTVNDVAPASAGFLGSGYLCALDSTSLAPQSRVLLLDPRSTADNPLRASVTDDSTASPTIGPDGDVYYGVLEGNFPTNNDRGWLLHFDAGLATTKTPGAFG
jgi:hypothetical protein